MGHIALGVFKGTPSYHHCFLKRVASEYGQVFHLGRQAGCYAQTKYWFSAPYTAPVILAGNLFRSSHETSPNVIVYYYGRVVFVANPRSFNERQYFVWNTKVL